MVRMKSFFLCVSFLVIFAACSKSDENASAMDSSDGKAKAIMLGAPQNTESDMDAATESAYVPIGQKIIKEGTLRFESDDLIETYQKITNASKKYRGVVQNDVEGKDNESIFRNITIRIPSDSFDLFLSDIGKDVSYFDHKEISARDVTEEYIDIDARLKAKKMLEARYLELLKKAGKVSEIIEIEKQLAAIREEIESKEGQLRYMQSRISLSTINITFYKRIAAESGVTVSYGSKMWNAIKSGFNGISSFFIGVLYMWPFIIILVVLIYFLRRRFGSKKTL